MSAPQEPAAPRDGGLLRVRLDLAYDGTAFSGWARQPGRRTVQEVVEDGLATVLRTPVALTVAGRTDAGVHARGQVAHADLPSDAWLAAGADGHARSGDPGERTLRRLRGVLPPDVAVHAVRPAPPGFDARFSARARRYAYRVADAPGGPDPLRRADTLAAPRPLDVARMQGASAHLLGLHDFLAYCRPREGATTTRTLQRLDWSRDADGVVTAVVEADAFCHSMVRSLVGALLAVGEGRRPVHWPAELLAAAPAAGRASVAAPVAPAHGLTLLAVDYPPDDELAARAEETRARR